MRRYYSLACDSISLDTSYLLVNMLRAHKVSYILCAGPAGFLQRQFDCYSYCSIIKSYDEHNTNDKKQKSVIVSKMNVLQWSSPTLKHLTIFQGTYSICISYKSSFLLSEYWVVCSSQFSANSTCKLITQQNILL